ncbi:hypothetical protein P7K49_002135 [Saguinus oedipus]|uniref:Lipocalin/cytosolic fatty-acid binding domain-containing protein n=1 Tax=Saguinus oedipus TaxID=9490 RepID=A0ABQ9WGG8_SAGOE|nr:hypothetical protein P7K49_002135 [Saguinus oedipus]
MRPPCGLWLWLSLLKVLQGQTPTPLPLPSPMQSFQGNQFQGEWFVLGLAGNSFRPEHRALLNPFTATFELGEDGRFQVWNAMTRGQRCDTWSYVLIPAAQPGQFTVDHGGEPGADREETRVVNSDYTQFALMLSRRNTGSLAVLRISLLGRSWFLPPGTLDQFICLGRAQGLSDDNIVFPDVTDLSASWPALGAAVSGAAGPLRCPKQWLRCQASSPGAPRAPEQEEALMQMPQAWKRGCGNKRLQPGACWAQRHKGSEATTQNPTPSLSPPTLTVHLARRLHLEAQPQQAARAAYLSVLPCLCPSWPPLSSRQREQGTAQGSHGP